MANHYTQSSSKMSLAPDQIEAAKLIIVRVEAEITAREKTDNGCDYCSVCNMEPDGIWFHGEENTDIEHVAEIVQSLLDGLKIDAPFVFSWAYTCSKPVLGEFGGGACALKRGCEPFWVDAMSVAEAHFK